ncbi:hypothetical protein GOP47_0002480 [Adiantum capillus-veneris]|uniref:SOSEKI DIX-like domain-containing protein n=1 Tax=Adiantum capillus-veneris TaxID=13818 RepID=A0A9D4VC61_ADICA|nr:hypothetical protein GOP47_0002480 [Adiantum capillus-veneris]
MGSTTTISTRLSKYCIKPRGIQQHLLPLIVAELERSFCCRKACRLHHLPYMENNHYLHIHLRWKDVRLHNSLNVRRMRIVRIIYYLSREGQLEEPHLLEVPMAMSNSDGLHLIEVKTWLTQTRGRSMAASFSWSYRRNYKEGCIWQDVSADEDLILPASEDEYILKGSKVAVASKELWPAPVFAKLDQNSYSMHGDYDRSIRVKEGILTGGTKGLHASDEQVVNVAEDFCELTSTDGDRKSNVICDQHSTLIDARPMTVLDSLIPDETGRTLEHAYQNGKRQERKSHRVSGNSTMNSLHGSCPTALTGTTCEVVQAKGVTTDSCQIDKEVVDLNIAENAKLSKTVGNHIKCETMAIHDRETDNERLLQTNHMKDSDERDKQTSLNVIQDATSLQTVDNQMKCQTSPKHLICGAPCDATDSIVVALASENFQRAPIKATHLKSNGYRTTPSNRAIMVEKRLDSKPTKQSTLQQPSCKSMKKANMTRCEDKRTQNADKSVVMRRRIKTNWGCRYTPVQLTHVKAYNIGGMSACKPQLPSSNGIAENVIWEIGERITGQDKKSHNERVSYSDELGVQLPATMVVKDIAVHMSEPLCPLRQRLLTKQAPLSYTLTPAYDHKKATSQYPPKKTSLPVFGSEKRQQQLLEELDSFRINSGISDISLTKKSSQSQLICMQQASKMSWHEENSYPMNPVVHSHDRAFSSQNVSRKDIKSLWEELLQTTQDALTHQETI